MVKSIVYFLIVHLNFLIRAFILTLVVTLSINPVVSQITEPLDSMGTQAEIIQEDTVLFKTHSPHRATLYSFILPGLGQAYNKKYWKIPVIYAGFGAFFYFIKINDKEYKEYRKAYYHSILDDGTPPVNEYEEKYDSDFLLKAKDYYRRNRDLTYILTGVWYLLNVVDAAVDAHLFTWNVDDDLTFKIQPAVYEGMIGFKPNGGIRFTIQF